MKAWPPFPETVKIDEALGPLLRVVNTRDPSRYDGLDVGHEAKLTCPPPDEYLALPTGPGLDSLRGRALIVAFQLGTEQGRRLHPTRSPAGMPADDYLLLAMSAGRRYLEATGWTAREWERDAQGEQRPVERGWTAPEGGEPVTFLEALHAGAFGKIGRL